jgi:glucose/arabinose dehydrogenase
MTTLKTTFALLCLLMMSQSVLFAQETMTTSDGVTYRVEKFMDANFPVGMVFTSDGALFYNEKATGNVRYVDASGTRQLEPVITLPTDALQERGMQSITLDPNYDDNGYVWVFHTAKSTASEFATNKVIRFRFEDGVGVDPIEMLSVPIDTGNLLHNGGGLAFDADGYLYVGIGDYGDPSRPQNLDLPHGKIHRFLVEGDALVIPDDNPIEGSSIYAYGLRNPFNYDFDPVSGRAFATENGDNCDDEVNLIMAGFNYGYREGYACVGTSPIAGLTRYLRPILSYTPTIAPSGITFYDNASIPQWENDLFFCSWNDGMLHHVRLSSGRNSTEFDTGLDLGADVTCRIGLVVHPDGAIYFGTVETDSGAIYRLVPIVDDAD